MSELDPRAVWMAMRMYQLPYGGWDARKMRNALWAYLDYDPLTGRNKEVYIAVCHAGYFQATGEHLGGSPPAEERERVGCTEPLD